MKIRLDFCVDIRAPTSIVGLREIRQICFSLKKLIALRTSSKSLQFADATCQTLGPISIPLMTPQGMPNIFVKLEVVSADVPALIGLNVLDVQSLVADTVLNRLVKKMVRSLRNRKFSTIEEWSVPLIRADDHLYVKILRPKNIYFTTTQLKKLHRQLFTHLRIRYTSYRKGLVQ